MEYKLIRTNRKTIELRVDAEANVIVRCPQNVSMEYVDEFVLSKSDWIDRACEKMRQRQKNVRKNEFLTALYLGKSYNVNESDVKKISFNGKVFLMPENKTTEEKKKLFTSWYKKEARRIFEARISELSKATGTSYEKLRISGAKTCWGSCSKTGTVSLNWKLIMASGQAIDYVILHELAHTIEMNHSGDFWNIVEGWMPDYKKIKEYLKDFSLTLNENGWNA